MRQPARLPIANRARPPLTPPTLSAAHPAETEPIVAGILELMSQVADKYEPEASQFQDWMARHAGNTALTRLIPEMTMTASRVLDAVGRLEPVNGATISKEFGIPKGSVSKSTRRL